jgi:hypothetical protein
MVGYVFDEAWGSSHADLLARFIAMTKRAGDIVVIGR